jgi:hypothetical protein
MADRFGLSSIADGIKRRSAELSEDADVRSYDEAHQDDEGPFKPFTFQQEDYDRTEPDKDALRKYWRQFETTPIVRKPITSFASQVMEPGYYIEAEDLDEDTIDDLEHWLSRAAILEGERTKDFRKLAKKAIIQQEVRGTAFIEKAPDRNNEDEVAGLKLINAETMEIVTRPGQAILLEPDDIDRFDGAPEAESGGAAAYLQDLGETETFFGTPVRDFRDRQPDEGGDFKIGFQKDEIIKLTRDADAGEVFGTSRIEAVSDRISGLKCKLDDNDEAIASKAYPLWLFLFGNEENPWDSNDIKEFMKSHEMENFHPGMKQGVRGDVSVETVSGEVAEISEYLDFDVNWIMSVMPMPKFALGAFGADSAVGQIGGIAQQQDVQRQIKDARRDIEDEFTPLMREVAQQMGISEDAARSIELNIGKRGEPETETPRRENIIRYMSDATEDTSSDVKEDGTLPESIPAAISDDDEGEDGQSEEPPGESAGAYSWHNSNALAELSLDSANPLADKIYETMLSTRDAVLNEVGSQFGQTPTFAATNFEQVSNRELRQRMSRGRFRDDVKPLVEEHLESAQSDLGVDAPLSMRQNTRFFVQDIEQSTENAIEEMLRLMRLQVRRGATQSDNWDDIEQRVRKEYDDANLRHRAELIAHMELKNATENVKLQTFEASENVVGVRVVNDDPSTPVTQSLAGAEVYFDDGDVQEQLSSMTRDEFLHQGFDPLPATPPYCFNDTTRFEPIYE